jgi:hypothetical protein
MLYRLQAIFSNINHMSLGSSSNLLSIFGMIFPLEIVVCSLKSVKQLTSSPVLNTPDSLDYPVANTMGNLNSSVINTLECRFLSALDRFTKKLSGDKKTRKKRRPSVIFTEESRLADVFCTSRFFL